MKDSKAYSELKPADKQTVGAGRAVQVKKLNHIDQLESYFSHKRTA